MSRKPVIVFEGIEGSGKSYHINKVSNYLKKKGINFIRIREPGGSEYSEKIRKLILDKKSNFDKHTDLLLYLAARNENIIKYKKYHKKKIILIDRFTDSTISYQHYGMGVNLNIINIINDFILKDFKADFTFLNTVSLTNMKIRLKSRKSLNRYDKFKIDFYSNVQKGFLKLANKNKSRYKIIDSNLDINLNTEIIINTICKIIK